ncbi:MAG: 50S ribosomal protein L5 [Candidatus Omnitrophica bacterium]|nr:50S ribosomal protein L5 [Candidatus Omnitrophota bacterium]
MARLLDRYHKEIVPAMCKRFGYQNPLQSPRLQKVVVNVGAGEGAHDPKMIEVVTQELALITGQCPMVTKAKKSISNFKIREGSPVGCRVTLRGARMYEFFDRLVNATLPRIRDFRGVSLTSFDEGGNYTLGIKEQVIFPEIEYDKIEKTYGMDITFVINSKNKEESQELLRLLGMPFRT